MIARAAWTSGAKPAWTIAGVMSPTPEWRCSVLYQGKEPLAEGPRVLDRAEPIREAGPILEGLEVGLGYCAAEAKARMSEGGKGAQVAQPLRTLDKVAAYVGMSGRTLEKSIAVVEAAKADPEQAHLDELRG